MAKRFAEEPELQVKKYLILRKSFIFFSNSLLNLPPVNHPSKHASTAFKISWFPRTLPDTGTFL